MKAVRKRAAKLGVAKPKKEEANKGLFTNKKPRYSKDFIDYTLNRCSALGLKKAQQTNKL